MKGFPHYLYVADAGYRRRFQLGYQSNTHTWPLHMVFHLGQFRLFYKVENPKQNEMDVRGILITSPHTASLLSPFTGHGSHDLLPRFKGKEHRPHYLTRRVSPHCKNVWDGIRSVNYLCKLWSATITQLVYWVESAFEPSSAYMQSLCSS